MFRACIAVVDATRARLFTFEREATAGGLRENLVEISDLVNPARRRRPSELFSDTRPGTNRSGRLQYAFDDHREAHLEALDAEFARNIVGEIDRLLQASPAKRLILCAGPNMLGELRDASDALHLGQVVVDEHPCDLAKLTPAQIRDQLAACELLPARPPRPSTRRA